MNRRIIAFLWTVFILVGSLMPKAAIDNSSFFDMPYFDKVGHFVMYAVFVYLWATTFHLRVDKIKSARIAFYSSILLGIVLEYAQYFMASGRNFDIQDIIANISGSILGLIVFYKIEKN